ncbi:MAG: 50S ribosomal protein L9 [Dehalococcoidia bacterium]
MKVLFLQDVRPTARAGDVKEVKNGFGRNYLLPQGLAVMATREELKRAEGLRREAEVRRRKEASEWKELADTIRETPVEIKVRSGPTGRLYGSVTNAMIAEKLSEIIDRDVERRGIRIPQPIRTLGTFAIPIRLAEGVETELKVVVEAENPEDVRPTFEEAIAQADAEESTEEEAESDTADAEDEQDGEGEEEEKDAEAGS